MDIILLNAVSFALNFPNVRIFDMLTMLIAAGVTSAYGQTELTTVAASELLVIICSAWLLPRVYAFCFHFFKYEWVKLGFEINLTFV